MCLLKSWEKKLIKLVFVNFANSQQQPRQQQPQQQQQWWWMNEWIFRRRLPQGVKHDEWERQDAMLRLDSDKTSNCMHDYTYYVGTGRFYANGDRKGSFLFFRIDGKEGEKRCPMSSRGEAIENCSIEEEKMEKMGELSPGPQTMTLMSSPNFLPSHISLFFHPFQRATNISQPS